MASNFRELGSTRGYLWSLVGGVSVIGLFALLPLNLSDLPDGFPSHFIALGVALVIGQVASSLQGEAISTHLARGGIKQSGWKATGLTLLWLGVTLVAFIAVIMVVEL
jgi:hypothetical protein